MSENEVFLFSSNQKSIANDHYQKGGVLQINQCGLNQRSEMTQREKSINVKVLFACLFNICNMLRWNMSGSGLLADSAAH